MALDKPQQEKVLMGEPSGQSLAFDAHGHPSALDLSIIIPVLNEEQNIPLLYEKLISCLSGIGLTWEAIFIDDGSTDSSYIQLRKLAAADERVNVVKFVRNFGQTAALAAGIDHSRGNIIIPMDADLQNDPVDIKRMIDKLNEGFDVVSGWRKDRHDALFSRKVPSWMANKLISVISGVRLHDYGCSLKAYRRKVIKSVRLYGEMHRFVPIYATWQGARVTELPVTHHARTLGKSKYGIGRTLNVVLDLITVKFMSSYMTKPIYLFGLIGLSSIAVSFVAFVWAVILKYFYDTTFIETPLPVLCAMFLLVGVQFILMGLLSEMLMRTYHESQDKRIYILDEGADDEEDEQQKFTAKPGEAMRPSGDKVAVDNSRA
jgi:glycosyltransferase involved in cell wall biosynthesis